MIRSMLSAHGIEAMIPGGGAQAGVAAVGFVTHVFVDPEDAEQAAALIAEMRATAAPAADDDDDDDAAPASAADLNTTLERRTRGGAVVLLAVMIQFGTGHMSTGAWKRGFALAALEIFGIRMLWTGNRLGTVVVVGAVVLDLVGAVIRTYRRASPASRLPVARLSPPRPRD